MRDSFLARRGALMAIAGAFVVAAVPFRAEAQDATTPPPASTPTPPPAANPPARTPTPQRVERTAARPVRRRGGNLAQRTADGVERGTRPVRRGVGRGVRWVGNGMARGGRWVAGGVRRGVRAVAR